MTSVRTNGGSGDGGGGSSGIGGGRTSNRCGAVRGEFLAVASCSCGGVSARPFHPSSYVSGMLVGVVAAAVVAVARGASRSSSRCPYVIRTGDRAGQTCRKVGHTQSRCFSCPSDTWRADSGDAAELIYWLELLRRGVDIFALGNDAILAAMYALTNGTEGDCHMCVLPDPGIEAAPLGASESALPGTAPAEALHTFTLDLGASCCFFRDSTTLTPLSAPVPARLADPSGGPVLARSSTVLPYPAVPSGSLSGLHLPLFSTNLVSTAALHDAMVTTTTLGGQYVSICTCTWTGCHLATFTHRPGSSLYTLATKPPHLAASNQGRERYFLLVVDDYMRYTTVSPLRSKGEVPDVLIPWICAVRLQLRERFCQDLPVLRMHSDRGGDFSSDLLRDFGRGEGILQFTLLDSPHQNGIAERRIGLVMEPNLLPCVSLPGTSPTLRWTGEFGDASVFRVWGSRAFVRDTSADKLFARAIPCVFLGFPPIAPGWQFYHPTSRCVLPSQDVTFDEPVPFYRLFPYRSAPLPPPPLFLDPGPPPVDPFPSQCLAPSGVSQVDPLPGIVPVEVALDSGAARGTAFGGAASGGAEPGGAESGDAEPRGSASSRGPAAGGSAAGGTGDGGVGTTRLRGAGVTVGAGGTRGAGATCPGVARTQGTGVAGTSDPGVGGAGAGGTGARGTGAGGAGDIGAIDPRARGAGAGGAVFGAGGTVQRRPFFVLPQPTSLPPPDSVLLQSRPALPVRAVRTGRRVPCLHLPPVPGTQVMVLRPYSVPLRVPMPPPLESSLPAVPDPESNLARAARPTVSRLLATVVTDPSFESVAASALVAQLVDIAAACRLDFATALIAEAESACPPFAGGEGALDTNFLEVKQEEFECLAAAVPHLVVMLLAPEGDPDAPDIPTPRSYAEAITGPYSSQWQTAMDAEMASLKSTSTYVDAFPPSGGEQCQWHVDFQGEVAAGFSASLQGTLGCTKLQTTLTALWFAPSTADPSLFLRTDTSLLPFYVLVYVDNLVFATADTEALALVKSEMQKRHTLIDLDELRSYLGLHITRDRARRTITLTQSHMVHQVLQRFGFQYSSPQSTPLPTGPSQSAPPSDDSVGPSGPYPELVGCLMYLMTCTRPDLAYPLSILARYVAPGRHRLEH
ncbi:unnamed protein product [Closterium sp. NIES-54]